MWLLCEKHVCFSNYGGYSDGRMEAFQNFKSIEPSASQNDPLF